MTSYYTDAPGQGSKVTITQLLYKTLQAEQPLTLLDLVFLDGSFVGQAQAGLSTKMPAIGLASATVVSGANVDVTIRGVITNTAWTWTSGAAVFAALSGGAVTQTPPSASGQWVQNIGLALTRTSLNLDPKQAYQIAVS